MSARSLASAALLALGVSMLPSAGNAEPLKASNGTVSASYGAFQIPGTVQPSNLFSNGQRFDASWTAPRNVSYSMIPWPRVICIWVGRPVCWIQFVE
jgi:hypothetical protein